MIGANQDRCTNSLGCVGLTAEVSQDIVPLGWLSLPKENLHLSEKLNHTFCYSFTVSKVIVKLHPLQAGEMAQG